MVARVRIALNALVAGKRMKVDRVRWIMDSGRIAREDLPMTTATPLLVTHQQLVLTA